MWSYQSFVLLLVVHDVRSQYGGGRVPSSSRTDGMCTCEAKQEELCNKVKMTLNLLPQNFAYHCNITSNPSVSVFHGVAGGSDTLIDRTVGRLRKLLIGYSTKGIETCLRGLCETKAMDCPMDDYATFDGKCNNRDRPFWGSVGEEQRRELHAIFDGGYNSARFNDRDGNPLPDVRTISNELFTDETEDAEDPEFTLWVMTFSQMVDHDMTLTPMMKDLDGTNINCCNGNYTGCENICINIATSDTDPHFGDGGTSGLRQRCLNFVRSVPAPCCSENCIRTPINMVSAYLDGNPTYGNSDEQAAFFRENNGMGAKLKAGPYANEGQYPQPHPDQSTNTCLDGGNIGSGSNTQYCYISGDTRHHVVPSLAALITMFVREHNRIVDGLRALNNPGWDDERYYQEARKIVMAEYQMFTIRDLTADVTLDDATATKYDLNETYGYDNVYDDTINAQVSVQFSTASYRFGHSLVNKFHGHYNRDNNNSTFDEPLHHNYNRVKSNFMGSGMSGLLRYIGHKGMKPANGQLSATVRNFLFLELDTLISLDLASLNIMRGRDHGLPDYNSWRNYCGLPRFPASHTNSMAKKIRTVYSDREDEIDLFAGAMTEIKRPGALVGDLFACLIGEQFHKFKYGDRYYYQNAPDFSTSKGRFKTEAQVRSLQKMTLARVLCETTETTQIQPDVFRRISERNPLTSCNDKITIPDIDLTLWKE